jgi:hypothetical protein
VATKNQLVNIDFGKLSKPVNTCVEKFSDAVGGLFKSRQVVRMAKAEAEAATITARANVEVSEIEKQGLQRMIREQGRHQGNMENVVLKAIPHIKGDVNSDEFDDDWLTNFFDKCRLISDEEMQTLWAKILADQANKPESFSKKTVEIAASLDKADAHLFTKSCRLVWDLDGEKKLVVFLERDSKFDGTRNVFGAFTHLAELGLLTCTFDDDGSGYIMTDLPENRVIFYFGRPIYFVTPSNYPNNTLFVGSALLSRAGSELATICGATPSNESYEDTINAWIERDFTPSCPIDSKDAHSSW